jgi:dUTP pyrophosphatase
MNILKVKKIMPSAVLPTRSHDTDAGYDVYAVESPTRGLDELGNLLYYQYRTGLAIEPPEGYHVELFPRSSVTKTNMVLGNSIGLVDEGYRGELMFRFKIVDDPTFSTMEKPYQRHIYKAGDRIGQIVLRKTERFEIEEMAELVDSARGSGGFGSTGN